MNLKENLVPFKKIKKDEKIISYIKKLCFFCGSRILIILKDKSNKILIKLYAKSKLN